MRAFQERLFAQISEDRRQSWVFLRQLAAFAHEPKMGLQIIERLEAEYAEEARAVPINPPHEFPVGVVPRLVAILTAEEKRLAMEAKLPWARFLRRAFEAVAIEKAQKESR